MQKRVELIQQIRAMESVPIIRTKFVDPTATSNRGFFTEMSLTEVLYNSIGHYVMFITIVVARAAGTDEGFRGG